MYGSPKCSSCIAQKAKFGDAFQYITFINCDEQDDFCKEKRVDGYPTWIQELDGSEVQRKTGVLSIADLESFGDCPSMPLERNTNII